jgi:hypothetical protein
MTDILDEATHLARVRKSEEAYRILKARRKSRPLLFGMLLLFVLIFGLGLTGEVAGLILAINSIFPPQSGTEYQDHFAEIRVVKVGIGAALLLAHAALEWARRRFGQVVDIAAVLASTGATVWLAYKGTGFSANVIINAIGSAIVSDGGNTETFKQTLSAVADLLGPLFLLALFVTYLAARRIAKTIKAIAEQNGHRRDEAEFAEQRDDYIHDHTVHQANWELHENEKKKPLGTVASHIAATIAKMFAKHVNWLHSAEADLPEGVAAVPRDQRLRIAEMLSLYTPQFVTAKLVQQGATT